MLVLDCCSIHRSLRTGTEAGATQGNSRSSWNRTVTGRTRETYQSAGVSSVGLPRSRNQWRFADDADYSSNDDDEDDDGGVGDENLESEP